MNKQEHIEYVANCKRIFKEYGKASQSIQLIQECSELINAITKFDTTNMIEEMADIQVLIDQFCYYNPQIANAIDRTKLAKAQRQINRIETNTEIKTQSELTKALEI
jgi:uncharacterized protein YabN with tetrapyrrole methylase and pyrophosphatase domain